LQFPDTTKNGTVSIPLDTSVIKKPFPQNINILLRSISAIIGANPGTGNLFNQISRMVVRIDGVVTNI
jgi:hypothetical protein